MIAAIEFELHAVTAGRRAELDAHDPVTVTEISPVTAITVGFLVGDHARDLDDQRSLSQALGLDAPAKPPQSRKTPEPVTTDFFRRGRRQAR